MHLVPKAPIKENPLQRYARHIAQMMQAGLRLVFSAFQIK
jgi:hypothetical protein